jgi:arginine utilization protein RocB
LDPGRDHSTECPTYLDAPHTVLTYDELLERARFLVDKTATRAAEYEPSNSAATADNGEDENLDFGDLDELPF